MIVEDAIHDAVKGLKSVLWRETAFADLQWYYAEEGVYVLRCKKGDPNEHLCVIRAKSADEAISRAVFNLYKADEKKKSAPVGDVAALRDAMKELLDAMYDMGIDEETVSIAAKSQNCHIHSVELLSVIKKANAALAKPPRNCDVGTAEEQAERYGRYCDKFTRDGMHCETCPCCGKIPFGKCEFAWAQMPYTEEGAK